MGALQKVGERLARRGPRAGLASLVEELRLRLADRDREVVLLRVDLTDPRHHPKPRDQADGLAILPFTREHLPRLLEMLAAHAPDQVERVHQRWLEGMSGFIAVSGEEVLGYTFYTPGASDPHRVVHRDLEWLPMRPGKDEVYAFDYFLRESARGRGATFVRAVQAEQARLGYTAAFGYVYAKNRPALWLYRTTGWQEVGRLLEHRYLSKLAVVEGTVFWMHPHSRAPLARLPASFARPSGLEGGPR